MRIRDGKMSCAESNCDDNLSDMVDPEGQVECKKDNVVSLVDYVTAFLPLAKLCLKNDIGGLISRIFYGLEHPFSDWQFSLKYSEAAIITAKKKKLPLDKMILWKDPRYIKSGKRKVLHREHVYTGTMFKKGLQALSDEDKLTIQNVVELIKENYSIAWIDMLADNKSINSGSGFNGKGYAKSNRGLS